jgi:hypothetical protein
VDAERGEHKVAIFVLLGHVQVERLGELRDAICDAFSRKIKVLLGYTLVEPLLYGSLWHAGLEAFFLGGDAYDAEGSQVETARCHPGGWRLGTAGAPTW